MIAVMGRAGNVKAQKVNGSAVDADMRVPVVATQDVAREAADRLRRRDFAGHEIRLLLGPEEITMAEATKAIGERLGMTDLPYVEFPPGGVGGSLVGAGMSEQVARLIVDMQLAVKTAATSKVSALRRNRRRPHDSRTSSRRRCRLPRP